MNNEIYELQERIETLERWKTAAEKLLPQETIEAIDNQSKKEMIYKEMPIGEIIDKISKGKNKFFKRYILKSTLLKRNIKTVEDLLEQEDWLRDEKQVCESSSGVGPYTYKCFINELYQLDIIKFNVD